MGCVTRRMAFQTIYYGYSSKEQLFSGIHRIGKLHRREEELRERKGIKRRNALEHSTVISDASN